MSVDTLPHAYRGGSQDHGDAPSRQGHFDAPWLSQLRYQMAVRSGQAHLASEFGLRHNGRRIPARVSPYRLRDMAEIAGLSSDPADLRTAYLDELNEYYLDLLDQDDLEADLDFDDHPALWEDDTLLAIEAFQEDMLSDGARQGTGSLCFPEELGMATSRRRVFVTSIDPLDPHEVLDLRENSPWWGFHIV